MKSIKSWLASFSTKAAPGKLFNRYTFSIADVALRFSGLMLLNATYMQLTVCHSNVMEKTEKKQKQQNSNCVLCESVPLFMENSLSMKHMGLKVLCVNLLIATCGRGL